MKVLKRGSKPSSIVDLVSGGVEFSLYSFVSLLEVDSEMSQPLSVLGILLNSFVTLNNDLSGWLLVSCLLYSVWVGSDGFMDFLIEIFACLGLGGIESLLPFAEMSLELLWVFFLHFVHVLGNVVTHDSISVSL